MPGVVTRRTPSLRLHKATGQALIHVNGRSIYLGRYGLPETEQRYHQVVAEYLATGHLPGDRDRGITIVELLAKFVEYAQNYYRNADGSMSTELENVNLALRHVRGLYSHTPAAQFGPVALRAVRQRMIDDGLCRSNINKHIRRVKMVFKWAASEELIPGEQYYSLEALPGLRRGRCNVREGTKVRPVSQEKVDALKPYVTAHGFLDASGDPAQIERWWAQHPRANLGIPTQGLLVIDIDGADNRWLADQPERLMDLARGAVSTTPRGGRHYLFRQPVGKAWRCSESQLAPHVDVRADGGYIVVPPSVTGAGTYAWQPTLELNQPPQSVPEPPAWLAELLDALAEEPAAPTAVGDGNLIAEGQRNRALTRLAGAMRRVGMAQAEIAAALHRANADRCTPPLAERDVDRIAASVARYEPDQVATAVAEGHFEQMQAAGEAPDFVTVRQLMADHPEMREPVLHGLLRRGETMNLISAPKIGKSWLVLDLALAVVTGRMWLEQYQTERGDVLILDNELHPETIAHRIPQVAEARRIWVGL